MKKPENWYIFHWECELHKYSDSNMLMPSRRYFCQRKDRQGKTRPYWVGDRYYGVLKCHWNVCPKLKKQRKAEEKQ